MSGQWNCGTVEPMTKLSKTASRGSTDQWNCGTPLHDFLAPSRTAQETCVIRSTQYMSVHPTKPESKCPPTNPSRYCICCACALKGKGKVKCNARNLYAGCLDGCCGVTLQGSWGDQNHSCAQIPRDLLKANDAKQTNTQNNCTFLKTTNGNRAR